MLDDHHLPNDPIHHFNRQFSSENGRYESRVPPNSAPKPRKQSQRYDLYDENLNRNNGETESGINSPPLWNNIPPESPGARVRAIVKGQKELMEMAKKMPESYYELTLKDLVEEHTKLTNSQEECLLKGKKDEDQDEEEGDRLGHEKMDSRKLTANKKNIEANSKDGSSSGRRINGGGIENKGLFLKMVFLPFGIGMKKKDSKSKKKKNLMKSSSSSLGSAKISPKTEGCDNDWLKKIFSSGSDRSRSSSNHSTRNGSTGSSNSVRTRKGFLNRCLLCFHSSTKGNA